MQVFGAQAIGAAKALQRIEILRERQTTTSRACVELDALRDGLRGLAGSRVFGVDAANPREGLIRPILSRGARRPMHAMWREDCMRGDFLGCVEILREQRRRHHERRADIRESFACRAIDRKLTRGIERLHACQITQRVGVFHVREPPQHNGTGVARVRESDLIQRATHPIGELFFLGRGELLLLLRRHLAELHLVEHVFPDVRLFVDVRGFEIEVTLLLFGRVAVEAVGLEDGASLDGVSRARKKQGKQKTHHTSSSMSFASPKVFGRTSILSIIDMKRRQSWRSGLSW